MSKFAVTGIGLVTPLGTGKEINRRRLFNAESAVRYEISSEAFVGRVAGFDLPENSRQLAMAFIAVQEAMNEANLKDSGYDKARIGISAGESKINLYNRNFNFENDLPQQLRKIFDIKGPSSSVSAACATGPLNIIKGCRMIEEGLCDAVVCGSAETTIHPLYISAFKNLGVLSKQGVKPFDSCRDGFAIGEGAGFIIIEDIKKAVFRGAGIYCEIAGMAGGIYAANPLIINSSAKMAQIIKKAVKDETPDYIHMHGTATKLNDYYESEAVARAFKNTEHVSLSSTKASTGHLLGVSGMAGAAFSIMAMKENIVPPTLNFTNSGIPFGLDYTPNKANKKTVNSALSLSFGFGGQGAALYFKKPWGNVYV